MAQNGNHLCRLCGRTFTFSSNLRRHIRKMHLQSPSKVNVAFQAPPLAVNLQSATAPGLQAPDKQLAGEQMQLPVQTGSVLVCFASCIAHMCRELRSRAWIQVSEILTVLSKIYTGMEHCSFVAQSSSLAHHVATRREFLCRWQRHLRPVRPDVPDAVRPGRASQGHAPGDPQEAAVREPRRRGGGGGRPRGAAPGRQRRPRPAGRGAGQPSGGAAAERAERPGATATSRRETPERTQKL